MAATARVAPSAPAAPANLVMTRVPPPTFVSTAASIASPDNHRYPEAGVAPQFALACRFVCCCLPCRQGGAPTTAGPFRCERKGCTNTHGNWDAEHQDPGFPQDNGLPRIGQSGFCSYECAMQTYFDIRYQVCCVREGKAMLDVKNDFDIDCCCGCCVGACAQLCCMRVLYNPADAKALGALEQAGKNPGNDVEMGGAHCCCYTASPVWAQNTESLEVEMVGLYLGQIHKRDGMARMETTEELVEWLENYDQHEVDYKKVISAHVLASEKLYDAAFTERVRTAAAQFRTVPVLVGEKAKQSKPLQNCATIFELYAQARACELRLSTFLRDHGADPDKMHGDGHAITSLKGVRRAMSKIKMSYGGNILALTDVCRGSLMFADVDRLGHALAWLLDHPKLIQVLRIKNRFLVGKAAPGGYRDVLVNCRFPDDSTNHVFEVQLHLQAYHDLKKGGGGHKIYKIARFIEAVVSPTSKFNLAKAIEENLQDERKRERYDRVVERATGPVLAQMFRTFESQEHPGSIRGEKDMANLTVAYIGLCVGGAVAAEMASGGLAQQTLVDSPCPHPPKPKPKSVSDATGRVDDSGGAGVDEAEHANDASIVSRKAEMQARVLALLCEMNAVIAPLLLADGVDKDALDLRGALMARFQDDWMYANELKEMFDEGAFSDVLDSNASGSSALGEVESAIRVILVGLLDYDDDYVAFMAKKAEE
jgi:hypothetical protein